MNNGIIYMDDTSYATDALFHQPSESMRSYLTSTVNNYVNTVKEYTPQFADAIKTKFDNIMDSSAIQYVKQLKHRIGAIWEPNCIRYLNTVNDLQQAPDIMKRWVMAEPHLKALYLNNGISGYDKSFNNPYPNGIEDKHYDYRRVTDGIIKQSEEGVGYSIYYEDITVKEDILSIVNKSDILSTWAIALAHIESSNNEDPTSSWGGTF